MKKLNKLVISFVTTLMILSGTLFSVSADSVKTGGMTVMGDYTWACCTNESILCGFY